MPQYLARSDDSVAGDSKKMYRTATTTFVAVALQQRQALHRQALGDVHSLFFLHVSINLQLHLLEDPRG